MNVIYVCGKSYYFTEGYRGRVIHAKGIIEGLLQNKCNVEVVSGPKISQYLDTHDNLKTTNIGEKSNSFFSEIFWRRKLLKYLKKNIKKKDLAIIRYGFSNPYLTWKFSKICKEFNCYSIIEVNSLGSDSLRIPAFVKNIVRSIESYIISKFNKIYVVSAEEKKRIKEDNSELDIIVVPNATNNKEPAVEKGSNDVRFVYLGVLHDYYNFEEVVRAFENVSSKTEVSLTLVIYGYGTNESFLKESSQRNPQIKLMGKYDNNEVHKLVNRDSDILLLPYKKNTLAEIGSPMKLFEYMVLGAPILASNVGQLNDVFKTGYNGYIYKAGNVESLSTKMNYLIQNKKERKTVGYTAHKEAVQNYNWAKRMEQLLNSISN